MEVEIVITVAIDGNDKMISILLVLYVIQKRKIKYYDIQRVRLITGGYKQRPLISISIALDCNALRKQKESRKCKENIDFKEYLFSFVSKYLIIL